MRVLNPTEPPGGFFARVASAPARVLLLDYDGTLAPFHPRRAEAAPYPGVRGALDALAARRRSRVIVISGRSIADLKPLLGLTSLPELWGSHGWERQRTDGGYSLAGLEPRVREALDALTAALRGGHDPAGWERKPASIAIHERGVSPPQFEAMESTVREVLNRLHDRAGLSLDAFDGGLELRALGRSKGDAVRAVLEEEGPRAAAAYLGDDRTDEDAFRAIQGRGLSVLVRAELRETAADWWLTPPADLLWFLDRWRAACEEGP